MARVTKTPTETTWECTARWPGPRLRTVYHRRAGDWIRSGRAACGREILGNCVIVLQPDTLARVKAGSPTDVPRGRFCKACLARTEAKP